MIIICRYSLIKKDGTNLTYVKSHENVPCPYCQKKLQVIGSRLRIVIRQDGKPLRLVIRRLRCCSCKKISHELPDFIVPYKRYDARVIENALSETVDEEKVREENWCPAENCTIGKWRRWFEVMRCIIGRLPEEWKKNHAGNPKNWNGVKELFFSIERKEKGWLSELFCRLINLNLWSDIRLENWSEEGH